MFTVRHWRLVQRADYNDHEFPEGIVFYDARNKTTVYLPHPAGRVFAALKSNPLGLEHADLLAAVLVSRGASGLDANDLQVVLDELEKLQLITACA